MSGDHNRYQKPDYIDRRQWKYDPLTGEPVAKYSDIVSDGGLDPRNKFDNVPEPNDFVRGYRQGFADAKSIYNLPVGWVYEDDEGRMMFSQMPHPDPLWEPVYRAAPQRQQRTYTLRKWVGLTDEDRQEIERWIEFKEAGGNEPVPAQKIVTYVQAKLKEKNA